MTTLSPRLEIASRAGPQIFEIMAASGPAKIPAVTKMCLEWADALLAADSQFPSDESEMARTIQRLERRIEELRSRIYTTSRMPAASGVIEDYLCRALREDTEAAK